MKTLILTSGKLPQTISIPRSKSYANRLIILACLSSKKKTINFVPNATDVTNLIVALKEIGYSIYQSNTKLIIEEGDLSIIEERDSRTIIEVNVGEGGTTARFLATLLLLGKKEYRLKLGKKLKTRPWSEFLELARVLGAKVELQDDILSIKGPILISKNLEVDCSRTTQFASALNMVASVFGNKVIPQKMNTSQSYWQMTEYLIELVKNYDSFDVPMDWSSASYPMAFAALNHEIFFPGLKLDGFQSDSKFFNLLKQFKAVDISFEGMTVFPCRFHQPVKMDVSDCLDLVPTLGYFLSHVPGTHELHGVENLVHKESDRLSEVMKLLNQFDRKTEIRNNILLIQGENSKIQSYQKLVLPDDHRMVMSGALFLRHHAGGEISPVESVDKSYPGFFDLLN